MKQIDCKIILNELNAIVLYELFFWNLVFLFYLTSALPMLASIFVLNKNIASSWIFCDQACFISCFDNCKVRFIFDYFFAFSIYNLVNLYMFEKCNIIYNRVIYKKVYNFLLSHFILNLKVYYIPWKYIYYCLSLYTYFFTSFFILRS